jgi:hypothetical protein
MSTSTAHAYVAVLKLPLPVVELVKIGQSIVAAMIGNAFFPNPNPPLAQVTATINALDTAQTATKSRAPGTVAARNAARTDVMVALRTLRAYVQQVADANVEQSEAIITSARMTTKRVAARVKPPFSAKQGAVSGSAHLVVRSAALRASYEWEWSSDGGKTWTLAAPSLQAKTTITGLPTGASCQFRYRPVTKTGPADWSQPVTLLVQ